MRGYSGSIGSLTLTIISASAHTSSAEGMIVAPASSYRESSKPEPSPALRSTTTLCPASASARGRAGVKPTRYSLSFISLGSPTITVVCLQSFSLGTRARGFSDRCSHLVGSELIKRYEANFRLLEVDLINLRALQLAAVV